MDPCLPVVNAEICPLHQEKSKLVQPRIVFFDLLLSYFGEPV